jgi:hypothetical protein
MMMVSGFRGVNLVDPERIARTDGLDMMLLVTGLVVAVDYDDTVAVRRRWLIGPEVPWLTEEDETVPRRWREALSARYAVRRLRRGPRAAMSAAAKRR